LSGRRQPEQQQRPKISTVARRRPVAEYGEQGSLFEGDALRDEAIERLIRGPSRTWVHFAVDAIRKMDNGKKFTTDDLWAKLPTPKEPRAMGGAIMQAKKQGLIRKTSGYRKSTRPQCHSRPIQIWVRRHPRWEDPHADT